MKDIFKSTLLLLCGICLATACDDDRDDNPTLQTPGTFVLNQPAYSTQEIDLAHSQSVHFTWSQPDYGFPAAAQYQLQVSLTGTYTVSADEAAADKTGNTKADYATLENIFTKCEADAAADAFAKGLQQCGRWAANAVPATVKAYTRVMSVYAGDTVYSNSVAINVIPYYVELKDALPEIWYLTGSCIGSGAWGNDANSIGVSMIPMFTKEGVEYDKKTGQGIIEYVGYFPADASFKIIKNVGSWNQGFCGGGTPGTTTYRDGGDDPGNITLPAAGYYKITIDTKSLTCKIEQQAITPASYTAVALTGSFNGGDQNIAMTGIETAAGTINHVWKADVEVTADGTFKFTADGKTFGGTDFPFGVSVADGTDIPITAGKYTVFFNDITGAYFFFSK